MSTQALSAPISSLSLLLVQTQVARWKAATPEQLTGSNLYLDISKVRLPLSCSLECYEPFSNDCKYRSHSTSTVLIQQVPFSGLYFDEQVPSLQIRITVLFSVDLQTSRTALPVSPTTLLVFQNISMHFFYPCAHSVHASLTRCRLNRRKMNTYRETRPPSWENGTWQVPSQLSHSENCWWNQVQNVIWPWWLCSFDLHVLSRL